MAEPVCASDLTALTLQGYISTRSNRGKTLTQQSLKMSLKGSYYRCCEYDHNRMYTMLYIQYTHYGIEIDVKLNIYTTDGVELYS